MIFKGWQKTSLIEYPDKISTVLFAGGCNFLCPFCCNERLVQSPESLDDLNGEQVLNYLKEHGHLYQALVVTGGEPTIHKDLVPFIRKVKTLNLLVGLETNGTRPEVLSDLIQAGTVDFISMDIKAPLRFEKYRKATRLNGNGLFPRVLESIDLLRSEKVEGEFRITVVPELHTEEDILEIGEQLQGVKRLVLQQFKPELAMDADFRALNPFPAESFRRWQSIISEKVGACLLRGVG